MILSFQLVLFNSVLNKFIMVKTAIEHYEQTSAHAPFYLMMQVVLFSVYTFYFINTVRQYYQVLNPPMRRILVAFEMLMATRLAADLVLIYIYLGNIGSYGSEDSNDNKPKLAFVRAMHYSLYDAIYIENRVSIIFLYWLL